MSKEISNRFKTSQVIDSKFSYTLNINEYLLYKSTNLDFYLDSKFNEKFIPIKITPILSLTIFGYIITPKGTPAQNLLITLVERVILNGVLTHIPVCDMITDENGYYETIIQSNSKDNLYSIKIKHFNNRGLYE